MARPRKITGAAGGTASTKGSAKKRSFHQELVLNRWMLRFFNAEQLNVLKLRLGDDRHEGIGEDGQTLFFHELTRGLFNPNLSSETDLRRYDLNIVGHWQAITAQRNKLEGHELQMKYFQYLSLLFTEIYLVRPEQRGNPRRCWLSGRLPMVGVAGLRPNWLQFLANSAEVADGSEVPC